MATLHSKREHAQFKGPLTSDNYNKRIEALFKDLSAAYNKTGLAEENSIRGYQRMLKQQFALTRKLQDLEARTAALEDDHAAIVFTNDDNDDTASFDDTDFEVGESARCTLDTTHGLLLLPMITDGSISKITMNTSSGKTLVPGGLEMRVAPVTTSADGLSATIDTSVPEQAVLNKSGAIWERNVVVDSADTDGAILDLYVRIPQELSVTVDCNAIKIHPFPVFSVDILEVAVSTKADAVLSDADVYIPLNANAIHENDSNAVGWIAPGGWSGDESLDGGFVMFYFDPQDVTAVKIRLRTKNYFEDAGKFLYTYGLSALDIRDDKFVSSGKMIVRFDAPEDTTISSVHSVSPQIWNVAEAEIPDIFSYRVIWETAFESGIYTLNPVSLSTRVWVEVTLNKTAGEGTPALSGLVIDYD